LILLVFFARADVTGRGFGAAGGQEVIADWYEELESSEGSLEEWEEASDSDSDDESSLSPERRGGGPDFNEFKDEELLSLSGSFPPGKPTPRGERKDRRKLERLASRAPRVGLRITRSFPRGFLTIT